MLMITCDQDAINPVVHLVPQLYRYQIAPTRVITESGVQSIFQYNIASDSYQPLSSWLPRVDNSGISGGRNWPGSVHSILQTGQVPLTTAPPAPAPDSESSRQPGPSRNLSVNVATLAVQPPGMGTALDALNSHQSLTSRRLAANNLPGFELLHPQVSQPQKYSHPSNTNAQQPSRVGALLTPPSNSSSDAGSISAYVNNSTISTSPAPPSYSQGYWPPSNNFGTGMINQPWPQSFPSRSGFSPPSSYAGRNNSNSPTSTDSLTPTYDINHRAYFQTPIPGVSTSSGPSPTTQQSQPAMAHVLMNAQATTTTMPPTPPVQNSVDAYGQKLPPTPLYSGSQQGTPQQATFPPYQSSGGSSTMHHSNANGPSSRISPIPVQMQGEGQHQLPRRTYIIRIPN
ncbi:specific RNA polymerase II transcription factor [Histoplasma capsulatum]|uniref:Specific RNA polymerase II transcription factor n=1 Tax=Ajellomyces capsulatus TaxID=5037 RepID=A0A8A1MEI8_AJECA|nr:specific RNA polymerase II transcription factor [Histoplasma capsulatum]